MNKPTTVDKILFLLIETIIDPLGIHQIVETGKQEGWSSEKIGEKIEERVISRGYWECPQSSIGQGNLFYLNLASNWGDALNEIKKVNWAHIARVLLDNAS